MIYFCIWYKNNSRYAKPKMVMNGNTKEFQPQRGGRRPAVIALSK